MCRGLLKYLWKNYFLIFLPVYFFLCNYLSAVFAQPLSSNELISNARHYDGKKVIYQGEVVGDLMCRKNGCWLNVNDGNSAMGVWIPTSLGFMPKYRGGYKYRGDLIEIEGIFHHSCKEHLGETDIHAIHIRLVEEGRPILRKTNIHKINLTLFIWSLLCLILIWMRLKKI